MIKIQVFDPAMCCSTGICGADVEQDLIDFAADMDWAKARGVHIERLNLAKEPQAFADNDTVRAFLHRSGEQALPLILIDGEVALAGRYPKRFELARWAGLEVSGEESEQANKGCCSGDNCC